MNPFDPLYVKCNKGDPADKYRDLPEFPTHVDLEVTNSCNFRCLMCPTGNRAMKRPTGFMEDRVYYGIVAECAPHETALRFIGWGEPLLHPRIASFVRTASDTGLLTHINTNGSKLTDDLAEQLIDAGLSSLKFSFQGVDRKSFEEMRNTDFFDDLIETVKAVRDIRGDKALPFLHVSTSITYETEDMVEKFRVEIAPLVDRVSIGKTIFDYMDLKAVRLSPADEETLRRLAKLESSEKKHPVPCPEVYDKLSIHWDGSVAVCCNDFDDMAKIGKFPDRTLKELWRAPLIEAYRAKLAKRDYSMPLCVSCYDYAGLTEHAV